ncbi:MAG: polyphosphate polymerase domain-containing protein [Lachnospiraceae bacterium]|jgi:hypothetical protein|nr:polyphosphate polymerase domain-containing protein [Lachnospiraceae bacterium]
MDQGQCFRHELKYEIGYPRYLELRSRLQAVMCSDSHAGADGRYLIRSIYFDNYADKALREKRDGVSRREKFRIRYYNDDFSLITLEKKVKDNNLCRKLGAEITEAECRQLLDGRLNWMRGHPAVLVQELYAKMHYQILRPRVLVSYIREPYVYRAGNVRVTFDRREMRFCAPPAWPCPLPPFLQQNTIKGAPGVSARTCHKRRPEISVRSYCKNTMSRHLPYAFPRQSPLRFPREW